MARKDRKLDAMRKKRDKGYSPHIGETKTFRKCKRFRSFFQTTSSMDDLLKLMPIDTLEERILKTYGPNATKRTGAGGEELPPGLGGMVKGGAKHNRTDARKEMEYSEKMYEESKRKMDYKRLVGGS
jgi:hypothetical protein